MNRVRRIGLIGLMMAGAMLTPVKAKAQDTNAPPSPGSFMNSLGQYFGSHNPALSNVFDYSGTNGAWRGSVWASMDYQSGINIAASLGLEYRVYKGITLESVTRNANVGGTIVAQQMGAGLNFVVEGDVKLTAYLDGGYDFEGKQIYAAPGMRVMKALTANTFAGCGIEAQIGKKKQAQPVLSLVTGFRF